MIENWDRQRLKIEFNNIQVPRGRPSDIDFYYVGNKYMVFGEIKNEVGEFKPGQRKLYEKLANNIIGYEVYVFFITHNKFVEKGDTSVDVSQCNVKEYYDPTTCTWSEPKDKITFQEALNSLYKFYNDK